MREGAQPGIYRESLHRQNRLEHAGTQGDLRRSVGCIPGQAAAVSVIPGAVFSGALNGHFRAYATADGKILWDFDTATSFDTVNKVTAKGGSVDASGPTIANGMVLTNSGYGQFGGKAFGNVLRWPFPWMATNRSRNYSSLFLRRIMMTTSSKTAATTHTIRTVEVSIIGLP